MSIAPLQTIRVIRIERETYTTGSSPLEVLDDDLDVWFAKTTTYAQPFTELINEVICNRMASLWGFIQPELAITRIDDDILQAYLKERGELSARYGNGSLLHRPFICSKRLQPAIELAENTGKPFRRADWIEYADAAEFVKIGVFDRWICNKDRKPDNPNVLLYQDTVDRRFVPFDHTAAFAHFGNYNDIRNVSLLHLDYHLSLLNHHLSAPLAKFDAPDPKRDLKAEVFQGIDLVLSQLDEIFDQVPSDWGFSKKAKAHLKLLLSDENRNKLIVGALNNR